MELDFRGPKEGGQEIAKKVPKLCELITGSP